MPQGSRPDRVAEDIRQQIGDILQRDVRDPGIGFVTLTRVTVTADLQHARIFYTRLGDERERQETRRALERATPFLRRQLGSRLRLRRVPELVFQFDQSIEHQARIERILLDLQEKREARAAADPVPPTDPPPSEDEGP